MSETLSLLPQRPYLFRALFEWMCDNNLTPHVVVRTDYPNVDVPMEFVKDNQIVLNLAPRAVSDFFLDKNSLSFTARFGGAARHLLVPMGSIMAIFARENNAGMSFPPEPFYEVKSPANVISSVESTMVKPTASKKNFTVIENPKNTTADKSNLNDREELENTETIGTEIKKPTKSHKTASKASTNEKLSSPKSKPAKSSSKKAKQADLSEDATENVSNKSPSTSTTIKRTGRPVLRIVE